MVNNLETRSHIAEKESQEKAPDEGVRKSFLSFFWRLYSENIFRMREDKNNVYMPPGISPNIKRGTIKGKIILMGQYIFDEIEKKGIKINTQNYIHLLNELDLEEIFNFVSTQHFTSNPPENIRMPNALGVDINSENGNLNANEKVFVDMLNKLIESGQSIVESSKNPFIEDLLTKIVGKNAQLSQISSEVRFEIARLIRSNKNPLNIIKLLKKKFKSLGIPNFSEDLEGMKAM